MAWELTTVSAVGLAVAVAFSALSAVGWRHRDSRCGLEFTALMVVAGAWAAAYAVQLGFDSPAGQAAWWRVSMVAAAAVPTAWFLFTARYAERDRWLTRRRVAALALEPLAFGILCLLNPWLSLVWTSPTLVAGPVRVLDITFAAGYYPHIVYAYALVAAGIALVVIVAVRSPRLYRAQSTLLLVAALPPYLAHIAFTLGHSPVPSLDLTPFAFVFTGVAFALALFHLDLLDRGSLARRQALETTGDGLVVVDSDGDVVDVDGRARQVLEPTPEPGRPLARVFPDADLEDLDGVTVTERTNGSERAYDIHVSTLSGPGDRDVGAALVLHDVTDRTRYEQRLEVVNRVLRHNLRNDMNVILGYAESLQDGDSVDVATAADHIQTTAEDLVDLSEKARHLTRLDRSGASDTTALDLVAPLEALVGEFRRANPTVEVTLEAPDRARADVVDESTLLTAVENLVENAIEHNDADRPRVRLAVEADGGDVVVRVADNGPGIPDVELEALRRGRETPLRHGDGLGIWLAHWCVTASGGTMEFESTDCGGTTVALAFPSPSPSPSCLGQGGTDERDATTPGPEVGPSAE